MLNIFFASVAVDSEFGVENFVAVLKYVVFFLYIYIFTVTPLLFRSRSMEFRKPRRAERLYSSPFFVLAST